jgi:hypothetical protein
MRHNVLLCLPCVYLGRSKVTRKELPMSELKVWVFRWDDRHGDESAPPALFRTKENALRHIGDTLGDVIDDDQIINIIVRHVETCGYYGYNDNKELGLPENNPLSDKRVYIDLDEVKVRD